MGRAIRGKNRSQFFLSSFPSTKNRRKTQFEAGYFQKEQNESQN